MSAVLIALPVGRIVGLTLGAAIIAAAVVTVLRHRDFSHLAPLGVFVALIALATALSPTALMPISKLGRRAQIPRSPVGADRGVLPGLRPAYGYRSAPECRPQRP